MKYLLLYFGNETNPAYIVASKIENNFDKFEIPNNYLNIKKFILSSNFDNYDKIILLGVKPNSNGITFEKFAHNCYTSEDLKLLKNGKKVLKTKFDVGELIKIFESTEININISNNAGNYYCNCVYYWMLNQYPRNKIIFLHLSNDNKTINFLISKLNSLK